MRLFPFLLGRRLPVTRGRIRVQGIGATVVIARDGWGVPHVEASSPEDAWFGLGFCHAQDRSFQLETLLRVGRGTLSALVGPPGLAADRMSRRLGFARLAEAELPLLSAAVRAAVEAYVAGVNAGRSHGLPRRPHELVLLRARPTPWAAGDVLAFAGLQAFALSANWDAELARLRILAADGPQAVLDLEPAPLDGVGLVPGLAAAAGPMLERLADDLAAFAAAAPSAGGSNAWAIAGARTSSGLPLLANDPHLAPRLPAPWYLVHLRCPGWQAAGASFVGAPVMPIGHNGQAAWGITAALTDQADLFLEEVAPDGRHVRSAEGWAPCEVVRERIEVRGGQAVEEEVLLTPRGPIVSPLLEGVPGALSLSAVWLRPASIRGLLDVVAARDFEAFRMAFADWPGPALNVVYADAAGHIGYQLVGQLPRRRRGSGMLPLPGWLPDAGWHDVGVPFERMPFRQDPPDGFIVSANDPPPQDDGEAPLGGDWVDGYRAARLVELLRERHDWDAGACARLQLDVTSLPWRDLRDIALQLPVHDGPGKLGRELLAAWDGQVGAASAAASVYELWVSELSRRIARARAPGSWPWALGAGFGDVVPVTMFHARAVGRVVRLLHARPAGWLPRDWLAEAADALSTVVARLEAERGRDPRRWRWGRLRRLTLRHPAGDRRLTAGAFNLGPVPFPGDSNTPLQAASGPLEPLANPGFVPNARAVIDLADPDASRWALAGGQSGNPCSPHYRDMFPLWLRGESVSIPWSSAAVEASTVATLYLEPHPA